MTEQGFNDADYRVALETSSANGAVALGRGEAVVATRALSGPRMHAREFLPVMASLCADHGVEPRMIRTVFVSSGPGSFTGLRIAVTAARMLSLACDTELVPVPTLEVIAQNALDAPGVREAGVDAPPRRVVVMLDAKRSRVYAAAFAFEGDRYEPVTDALEVDPLTFLVDQSAQCATYAVLGEGVMYHRVAVEASGATILPASLYSPRAATVYHLGVRRARAHLAVARGEFIPTYIRPPEAEEKWERRGNKGA